MAPTIVGFSVRAVASGYEVVGGLGFGLGGNSNPRHDLRLGRSLVL